MGQAVSCSEVIRIRHARAFGDRFEQARMEKIPCSEKLNQPLLAVSGPFRNWAGQARRRTANGELKSGAKPPIAVSEAAAGKLSRWIY